MEIKYTFPPNYQYLKLLNPPETAVFCYGNTIYSPHGRKVPEDVQFHEQVHSEQQGSDPDLWYSRYIHDPLFRQEEEIKAFAAQYSFIKKYYPTKAHKEALEEMALALSRDYGLSIDYPQAYTHIRLRSKGLVLNYIHEQKPSQNGKEAIRGQN